MPRHFDLCIIGTGSGNSILGPEFNDWDVAMVERGAFGGTCLNRGCIPSKMLIYPADLVELIRHTDRLGVKASVDSVRWTEIRDRTFGRIDPIAAGGRTYRLGLPNVTVFERDARFVGHKELQVGDETITADRFVLAAGARSHMPPIAGIDEVGAHTSDTIMRIDRVPDRLTILGSGFIAAELGHVFESFGAAVTIVTRGPGVLRQEDPAVSERVTQAFSHRFDLVTHATPTSARREGHEIVIQVDTPTGPRSIRSDELLVATGRIPNGGQLGVERTGVELDAEGYVRTDDTLQTAVEGIWALGDIRNPLQLKHAANHEAKVVAHNLSHPESPRRVSEARIPHAVFTSPQVGAVGLTEPQARHHGRPYVAVCKDYGATAYGWAMEDEVGFVKLLADTETRRLIGAHIVGAQASLLLQPLVQAMAFDEPVDRVAHEVFYPHPALTEVIENALIECAAALDAAG